MIRPGPFICISIVLLYLATTIGAILPTQDPFSLPTDARQVDLDEFSSPAFGKMKVHHGVLQKRFDIGLFGNSRSLDIGKQHLKLGACSYFNFSLSGESLRASAALLERLAASGKAPRIALVSVDNFELQLYSNPFFLTMTERWRQGISDIKYGVAQSSVTTRELLKMIWRHAHTEWQLFKLSLNITTIQNSLFSLVDARHSPFKLTQELGKGYRRDGSRTQTIPNPPTSSRPKFVPGSRQILRGYLGYDLNRLKSLKNLGVEVIVYESPLDPINTKIRLTKPSPQAAVSRKDYFRFCKELGLNCHSALGKLTTKNTPWRDSNHPPAEELGEYINTLLGNRVRTCNNDL
jgi:hypothetical protein